ncbi:hypothetical protein DTO006G1_2597 [Penicillium roqueforti]|nr:uncharacterized protein LCP9604111_1793 [Penicillium roqueforti]KAF9251797.1 hypothetical protein LCP9604111_1793 [Penicillium roqueforti]KAI1836388.1 hypothetical protein CBS147337_2615 [Penicillium roqueforti]KAI2685473.1 hypothetical protein LCP963914a_4800 [Penicillium roqueforti]KAI2690156.1 hypothetical protein CBS147355_607 [Penicillium roqueforti]KAI2702664.1 hypothetical protein CBS147372_4397 [Penicillium roqueforti]
MGLPPLDSDIKLLSIKRDIRHSGTSSIYEINLGSNRYAMKLFHDENGDPGFADNGRDLNRFRCEYNAYTNLLNFDVCESGLVPRCYGYIDRLDPSSFRPHLDHFLTDEMHPRAIILEYLEGAEELNCVNYSEERLQLAIQGMKEIHRALINHHDVYPKNILITQDSMGRKGQLECEHEAKLLASFGEILREDQKQGLPPNTKFY